MTLEKDWEDLNIPLFIHGDGVDYANNDNLMVFSFGCLEAPWEVIWKHLHWSFQALADGRHPSKGPDGKPLEKGSVFYHLKGQLLHPIGLKGVIWSIIGDHEFF